MPARKRKRHWYSSPFWRSARNAILIVMPISAVIFTVKFGIVGLALAVPAALVAGFAVHMYNWWTDRPR